jgi:UDP-glucose 4-epimerase
MDEVIALAHTTIPKTSFEDPVICVRPRNAYGPGQIPFTGQGLVATAAASILTGREILSYGAEKMIRDYIHVRDIASGIVAALELGRAGECYNIGSGIGRSTKEVIEMITSCGRNQGYQASIRELPERSVDVSANVLDSLKLMTETGWKPEIGFDKGISETWRWYSDNQNRILTNEYSSYCRDLPTC